jgi:hypothetical protein
MEVIDSDLVPKSSSNFLCKFCDYYTCRKSQYHRHLLTDKHKIKENDSKLVQKSSKLYECECGKIYKYDSGYYRHKKICVKEIPKGMEDCFDVNIVNKIQHTNLITTELVMELIKDNKEMKQIMLEQNNTINNLVKNGITNTNISNNTNCNNKTFNLQLFLNETCKDAMNITDFVDSIKLELSDLMKVGELGYVEGISNIITSSLKALDITKRPVHCTDKKRETIYIKDEDKWEKDENQTKLKKVINRVSNKNIKLITEYREKYPECKKSEYKLSDKYNKMIIEAMGGMGNNNTEKEEKIIKNISKYTTIEKYSE